VLGTFSYSRYRVFAMAIILVTVVALWWFLERTRFGTIIRAGSRDPEMVQVLGINLAPVFTFVFGLGVSMAALAGLLAAPLGQVEPAMGNAVAMAAFVVVVIGGIGSFWGVILSGLLVGEVVGIMKFLWAPASEASMYILMALVLLVRPRGLFGERWVRFE
jgi:branched-chain amino acid transport system permease protein